MIWGVLLPGPAEYPPDRSACRSSRGRPQLSGSEKKQRTPYAVFVGLDVGKDDEALAGLTLLAEDLEAP